MQNFQTALLRGSYFLRSAKSNYRARVAVAASWSASLKVHHQDITPHSVPIACLGSKAQPANRLWRIPATRTAPAKTQELSVTKAYEHPRNEHHRGHLRGYVIGIAILLEGIVKPPNSHSQAARMLEVFRSSTGWVPAPVLHRAASPNGEGYCGSLSRRISDLRKAGYMIVCRDEWVGTQRHTWYQMLVEQEQKP